MAETAVQIGKRATMRGLRGLTALTAALISMPATGILAMTASADKKAICC